MNIRKVKRKCSVRGCKNTDCFAVSIVREVGNSVIICPSCLKEGVEAIDNYIPESKKEHKEPPPLFYNGIGSQGNNSEIQEEQKSNVDTSIEKNAPEIFVCPDCGKEYKTKAAYSKHIIMHDSKEDK